MLSSMEASSAGGGSMTKETSSAQKVNKQNWTVERECVERQRTVNSAENQMRVEHGKI
jgi:hypothetical protein